MCYTLHVDPVNTKRYKSSHLYPLWSSIHKVLPCNWAAIHLHYYSRSANKSISLLRHLPWAPPVILQNFLFLPPFFRACFPFSRALIAWCDACLRPWPGHEQRTPHYSIFSRVQHCVAIPHYIASRYLTQEAVYRIMYFYCTRLLQCCYYGTKLLKMPAFLLVPYIGQ